MINDGIRQRCIEKDRTFIVISKNIPLQTIMKDKNDKISEIDENIRRDFDMIKRLGKGAYGIVWKAIDKRTQQTFAVKKIFDAFRNETDAQRTYREITLLKALRNHPNIIRLYSIHRAANHMDIYLSFEFMESDLHNVIKRGSILKDIHKRFVMYQLLNATNFIHSGNIIHRDLKPSNILVDSKCRCKLADFGLARSLSPLNSSKGYANNNEFAEICLTDYVATRWYRAPEILIANSSYTKGIDMWSLACILGEMCRGKPMFPGTCTINQIECILSALPKPTESDMKSVGNGFGSALLNQPNKPNNKKPNMNELLEDAPIDAKHLVKSLLLLDPSKRLTSKEALCHKYVEKFRHTSDELELTVDFVPPFRDDVQLSVSEYRSKLYEIMSRSEDKKDSTPSPSTGSKVKTLPSEPFKKPMTQSNSRTILSRSIVTSCDNRMPTKQAHEPSCSSQKCQDDVKYNQSSYTNVHHQKTLNALRTTSASLQQQPTKHLNDACNRLTNKLNCCMNCNRDDKAKKLNGNIVSMPKLKADTKLQQIHSSSSSLFDGENSKCKLASDGKRLVIPTTFRRNSIESNNVMTNKATFKRSCEEYCYNNGMRRQSIDSGLGKGTAVLKKLSRKVSSSQLNEHDDQYIQWNANQSDNYPLSHSLNHPKVLNDKKRLIKQMSLDEFTNTTVLLRKLEMKMRKHKIDVLKYKEQLNAATDEPKKLLVYQQPNTNHVKLDPFYRTKSGCLCPKLSVDSVFRTKGSNLRKSTSSVSYGVLSAADLHKLRSAPE